MCKFSIITLNFSQYIFIGCKNIYIKNIICVKCIIRYMYRKRTIIDFVKNSNLESLNVANI